MGAKTLVGLAYQFTVEALSLPPDLSPATSKIALRLGSKAKATRHSPPSALNRNSFMLACREPLSVSTRGLPSCGPNSWSTRANARTSVRTSWPSASNSGLNSSAISTAHFTPTVWHGIHMMSTPCLGGNGSSGVKKRRAELAGGEGVEGAEAGGQFGGGEAPLAVEADEKNGGGGLPLLGGAFPASGEQ